MWNVYENHSRAAAPKTDGREEYLPESGELSEGRQEDRGEPAGAGQIGKR